MFAGWTEGTTTAICRHSVYLWRADTAARSHERPLKGLVSSTRAACRPTVPGRRQNLARFSLRASGNPAWSAAAPRQRPALSGLVSQAHKNMRAPQEIGKRAGCSATPIVAPSDRDILCSRGVSQSCASAPQPCRFCSAFKGGRCAGWAGGIEPPNGGIKVRLIVQRFQGAFGEKRKRPFSNSNSLAVVSKQRSARQRSENE